MANMLRFERARSLGGVAMLGIVASLAAVPTSAFAAEEQAATATNGAAEEDVGLEEIVVTAQHRLENLQDVPIAVTAVTASTLLDSGVANTNSLPQIVPSVQFSRSGPSGLFFVRGVGTTNGATGEEGANAVYVDGVYMPDLGQSVNNFNNIERVEVLKGPQGTLFGRNATGGLIHVITRDPGKNLAIKGQVGYSNYDTVSGQLYVGGPVTEKLGMDIALTRLDQSKGWGRNITLNRDNNLQDYWGVRSKAVYRASDAVKLTFAGDYYRNNDSTSLSYNLDPGTVGSGGVTTPTGYDTSGDKLGRTHQEIYGFSFKGEADIGFANLTALTGYRKNDTKSAIDIDGGRVPLVAIDLISGSKSFSQELRLASTDTEPLAWQVGLFYLNATARNIQFQRGGAFTGLGILGVNVDASLKTESYAAFGEVTYAITPTTHLTGGIRYTTDKRTFSGGRATVLANGTVGPQSTQANPKLKYNEITYRASIRQDITDDINVYGSVNRGFKAGLFSLQSPADPAVKPQFIMAYEVGLKSQLFDRRLRVNLAAYHYDIDDYQIRSGAGAAPGTSILLNAAKVKVEGVDAEFEAAPTDGLRIFGGATVLKSVFKAFGGPGAPFQAPFFYPQYSPVRTTCPAGQIGSDNPGSLGSGALSGGLVTCFGNASGNRTALAPKFAASLGASYAIPVGEESELKLSALYSYNSGYVFEPDNFRGQGAFSQINAAAEYKITENWAVELWGKNLANKTYFLQKLSSGTGATTIISPPRTYGLNVKINF